MLGLSSCLVRRVGGIAATVAAVALIAAPAALAATTVAAGAGVPFSGIVDSTPSCAPATATITWGDGTSGPAIVTGTAATPTTLNSLYTVAGTHTYAKPGVYQATVTVSASGAASVTANFTVTAP